MAITVETLEKLQRKIVLNIPADVIAKGVTQRLQHIAKTVKMDGFRPGKVPMAVVSQRHGYTAQMEVINEQIGDSFGNAILEAQLRVAGQPTITQNETATEGTFVFDAVFEVFPEITFDLETFKATSVEEANTEITTEAIDQTLAILRKQRRTFAQRSAEIASEEGDRLTVDFEGKIDGEPFQGGQATGYQFILGDGQMLGEFEAAAKGMKTGESKTFPLVFPEDYQGKDVAGKTADFLITVQKIEEAHLPEADDALALSLGIKDATVTGLRSDIEKNLSREVKARLLARNKQAAMNAILAQATFDVPEASVRMELERLVENTRKDLLQRGMKDVAKSTIPEDIFMPEAQRRVRLGLMASHLVKNNNLEATDTQVSSYIEEIAASYEKPLDVIRWYGMDKERLENINALVTENNLTQFVFSNTSSTTKAISFEELMGQNQ